MQALCEWDVLRAESSANLLDLFADLDAPHEALGYAVELVEKFWRRRDDIDQQIARTTANWDISRMSPVERNAMRVAVVEMLAGRIPPRVALDEAIEIAREYGGEHSPRFVNGILDQILKTLPGESGP